MATEADTRRKFIVPKLQTAGWNNDLHSNPELRTIPDRHVAPAGKGFIRKAFKGEL
jgi:type I restriction enzyme R subunit